MWKLYSIALAAFMANACETEPDQDSPEREACTQMCSLIACQGEVGSDQVSDCADRCMDKRTLAAEEGGTCADTYSRSVNCFSNLECDQYLAWESGNDTVCQAELSAFDDDCGDLTFDFRS